jgi:hypothetical protein
MEDSRKQHTTNKKGVSIFASVETKESEVCGGRGFFLVKGKRNEVVVFFFFSRLIDSVCGEVEENKNKHT